MDLHVASYWHLVAKSITTFDVTLIFHQGHCFCTLKIFSIVRARWKVLRNHFIFTYPILLSMRETAQGQPACCAVAAGVNGLASGRHSDVITLLAAGLEPTTFRTQAKSPVKNMSFLYIFEQLSLPLSRTEAVEAGFPRYPFREEFRTPGYDLILLSRISVQEVVYIWAHLCRCMLIVHLLPLAILFRRSLEGESITLLICYVSAMLPFSFLVVRSPDNHTS